MGPIPFKRRIDVLDLGFEDARRLNNLASKKQHRKKYFVGIDLRWREKGQATRQHNLKLICGDVLNRLKRLPSQSVRVVTADFLFTDEFKNEYGVEWGTAIEFGLPWHRERIDARFMERLSLVSREVYRVLSPRGRFFVIQYADITQDTVQFLESAGFKCSVKEVPENEIDKTRFLRAVWETINERGRAKAWRLVPMLITATKATYSVRPRS